MRSIRLSPWHTPSLTDAYDRAANSWHATISKFGFVEAYGDLLALANNRLPKRNTLKVLDAGSGTAAFSLAFAQQFGRHDFTLLDNSANMLERGAQVMTENGFACRTLCNDVDALADQQSTYDVILSAHLVEHVADIDATLRTLKSALTPDGVLVLVVSKPHWCTSIVRLRWGHTAYRVSEMQAHLRISGFNDIDLFSFSAGPPKRLSAGYVTQPSN